MVTLGNIRSLKLWGGLIYVLLLILVPFIITNQYYLHIVYLVFLSIFLAICWNILGGYAGQISLGHASFFGIGAYSTALLWIRLGVPPLIGIFCGGICAVAFTPVLVPLLSRLRGIYFAIGTFFLNQALMVVILNNIEIFGGSMGLFMPSPSVYSKTPYIYIAGFLVLASFLLTYRLINSKFGLAFVAIRENEDAAKSLGVNTLKYKVFALIISAFFWGIGGGLHAWYMFHIEPMTTFSMTWNARGTFMSVIGGRGTLVGPIIGALTIVLVQEFFVVYLGEINLITYAVLLIVIIMFAPKGILDVIRKFLRYFQALK